MSLTILTVADVQQLIDEANFTTITDTFGIVNGTAGEVVTPQELFDAIVQCLVEVEDVTVVSNAGDRSILVNAPVGFSTADLVHYELNRTGSAVELAISDITNDIGTAQTFQLSGIETTASGHSLVARFLKLKA